ncbi:MAG: lysophospholipid acyltransferase family protein [Actinobacteria bacterium]|nr:lysophospholipid acyltransferase family protein [Actinomycetota bacterium]MDA3016626.1 lysophospholipid acyltransferase family protein [Actinomycetota bacterium]
MTKVKTFLVGQGVLGKVLYRVVRFWILIFCRIYFRLRVYGRENIPKSGAFILAPIHRSNVDTPIVSAVTHRRLRFMGKDSLWKIKPIAAVLSTLGGFPVSRGSVDLEALKRCLAVLALGEVLVMFPEGTRQSGPKIHPLFDGAAYLALKADVPIVPVGFGGTEGVMPKGSKKILPRRCSVVIGTPIYPPKAETGRLPRTATADLTAELSAALQIVFDQAKHKVGQII